jgi:hypothetical protein
VPAENERCEYKAGHGMADSRNDTKLGILRLIEVRLRLSGSQ